LDYKYLSPEQMLAERDDFERVILLERLRKAVRRINPGISEDLRETAIKELRRISSPDLLANNETFHRFLTEGIAVSHYVGGDERGENPSRMAFR
jgi:type I restriction enzyme R subunit